MSPRRLVPSPSSRPPAATADDERSTVRRRASATMPAVRPSVQPGADDRSVRVEGKVQRALELLAPAAPNDSRLRLVRLAALRRDEVLLDGLLAELEVEPAGPHREPPAAVGAPGSKPARRGS
jgi:hypothetical protein